MTEFKAHTGAMNGWQQQITDVSSDVGNLMNGAPGVSGVVNSHGTIGHPMQNAFDSAYSSRGAAMGATQAASAKISELLGQASQAYDRGDVAAADKLKSQAAQMEGAAGSAGGSPAASAAGSGAQGAGQMMGQFSQMAGQMMQGITQPIQGMAQSLGQLPQQVFQGVQGIVEAATQGAGGGAEAAAGGAGAAAEAGGKVNAEAEGNGDAAEAKKDTAEDREKESPAGQLGNRAQVGIEPPAQAGANAVPTAFRNINPQR
ncbi:ESX-1 secretion-associated protein [Mycolicibacterium sp. XJ870]